MKAPRISHPNISIWARDLTCSGIRSMAGSPRALIGRPCSNICWQQTARAADAADLCGRGERAQLQQFFERVPLRSDEVPNPRDRCRFASNQALLEQFAIYQSMQCELIPAVHSRKAHMEDHNDLAPILNRQNDSLRYQLKT